MNGCDRQASRLHEISRQRGLPQCHGNLQPSTVLWRAGLPALGCEAVVKPVTSICLKNRISRVWAASRPNAGKPARYNDKRARLQIALQARNYFFFKQVLM